MPSDGAPAFPHETYFGLTKREWFVGQALAAGNLPLNAINMADFTISTLELDEADLVDLMNKAQKEATDRQREEQIRASTSRIVR